MQFSDHRTLALYLVDYSDNRELLKHRRAFVLGSLVPDINICTYVKGLLKGKPFKMHFTVNSEAAIRRKMRKLTEKKEFTCLDYYRLGVLTHLLADTFTYPHNEIFPGTMIEHAEYEARELHPAFKSASRGKILELDLEREKNLWDLCCNAHKNYSKTEPSAQVDICYIVSVCGRVCEGLIPTEKHAVFELCTWDMYLH